MRTNLTLTEEQIKKLTEQKNLTHEVELIVTNLEDFKTKVASSLSTLEWLEKQNIIRRLVKRIEIGGEEINIVYKINNLPDQGNSLNPQHCCNRIIACH